MTDPICSTLTRLKPETRTDNKKMTRVLVTGGAGFIGGQVVDALLMRGYDVTVLDNFSAGQRPEANPHLKSSVRVIDGDVRNQKDVRNALDKVDSVIHMAAIIDTEYSVSNPLEVNEVNVSGTLTLLHESAEMKKKRFIFTSSTAVYGDAGDAPLSEEIKPRPISPYGVTKLAGEEYCNTYSRTFGLETVSLRLFNVYGRGQGKNQYAGVVIKFIEQATRGLDPVIFGDGEQTRDFIHVSDVVAAHILALEKGSIESSPINIGTGIPTKIRDLARLVIDLSDTHQKPKFTHSRLGDIKHNSADTEKASRVLDFSPVMTLRKGLQELVDNYRNG